MNPYGQSGFRNLSEMNSNFEFGSPATTKLGPDKPTFTSFSSLSRPRMVKSRKSVNSGLIGSLETQKIDPGFNPFRPVSDNLKGFSSRLETDRSGELGSRKVVTNDDDDASMNKSAHLNMKVTNEVEKVGNALVDEIRNLRIENQYIDSQSANHLNGRGTATLSGIQRPNTGAENSFTAMLPNEMKKLNLGGACGKSYKISGGVNDKFGGSRDAHNVGGSFGDTLAPKLPNELKTSNLKDSGDMGGYDFVFGAAGKTDFVFGSNRKNNDSGANTIASKLPERIKNLNIEDSSNSKSAQKEMNVNNVNQTFDPTRTGTGSGRVIDTMILDEMEKLKIGGGSEGSSDQAEVNNSSSLRKEQQGNTIDEDNGKSNPTGFTSHIGNQSKHSSNPQVPQDQSNKGSGLCGISTSSTAPFPSAVPQFQLERDKFQEPCIEGFEKKPGFGFSSKHDCSRIPHVEFGTPDPKGNLFTGSNQKVGFAAERESVKHNVSRGRKGKLKGSTPVLVSLGKNFVSKESSFQYDDSETSETYSPMDVSPYRETRDDKQPARVPSLTSENQTSTDSKEDFSIDAIDEDLVLATERMDINGDNGMKHDEAEVQVSECLDTTHVTETESFNSASENLDVNGENEVVSDSEAQSYDQSQYFSASSSVSSGGSSFTFAAPSSAQSQASAAVHHHRKKNRVKAAPYIRIPTRTTVLSDSVPSFQFSPISRVTMPPSQVGQKDGLSTISQKGGIKLKSTSPTTKIVGAGNLKDTKITSPTASARAAQEACEKWRLRGNQAYANGDLEKADEYYTHGLSCIPQNETSRDCLRALVLCYSSRAATLMSLGRVREALRDCTVAAEIDPNFLRVQLRAANCYLALGEVGDASRYFKKLLQSNDVCVERKLILEASDGLQKAQEVSQCINRSAELLQQRTFSDAESVLGVINEALAISPYSDQLLQSKAEVLFMLRRYEEVIQLCKQTLDAAEKSSSLGADGQSSNVVTPDLLKNSFRIWRYCLIFKSNFNLGKLEEALGFLEKEERWRSMVDKYGSETLESLIPQLSTARELIRHKSAGNAAFQAGRHSEAVEHYTAALSFNVESRPFAAVCFGNRAAAYQALGQITDAIADCSLAITLDRNYLKAISRRATLFEMIRDYEQAAKDLQGLVSLLTKQAEEKNSQMGASLPTKSLADLRRARQRLYQMEEQAKNGIPLNFYLILGVELSVTAVDLKKAYRKAALRHHPDKAGQSLARSESGDDLLWKEIAEEVYRDADKLFKMIGEAYAILSETNKRSQYDIEEETRNGQKKTGGVSSTSRMQTDAPFNTSERSGGWGRQWREVWRSSANPYSRGFEPTTRSSRYY